MTAPDRDQQAFDYLKGKVLEPAEAIYWTCRPTAKLLSARHLFRMIAGVFLLTFAISWSLGLQDRGDSAWMSGLFILVAAISVFARPIQDYRRSQRTYYAITDRRVIIITDDKDFKSRSLYASDIRQLQRMDYRDGTSDLQLRSTTTREAGERRRRVTFEDGLWGITDTEAAASAISALFEES